MSITTNLSVSPYFDDYNEDKDYYRILFRPGVPVQVRELNQLQTTLQKQIERFGDTVVTRGTILSGCQPEFKTSVPFIKIKDTTANAKAVNVSDYLNLFVVNSSNLISRVISAVPGLESTDPDLNTLYLKYLNSGVNGDEVAYKEGSVLTIYNDDRRLSEILINTASQGFSNTDNVVILSAIQVQNTTGGTDFGNTFVVGEQITLPTTNATVEIISVDSSSNTDYYNIRVKPLTSQLAIANTRSWELTTGTSFATSNSAIEGTLVNLIGTGANAEIVTTNLGAIDSVTVNQQGSGYKVAPYVTISTKTASEVQIDQLNLTAKNYVAKVTVASGLSQPATGVSYHMNITSGTVYQKGHFLRVAPQSVLIDKYANTPDAISVGFVTQETIANSSIDSTLVDNASGFLNQNAPGAHRLVLTPLLTVVDSDTAETDANFYPLFKFSQGKLFSQRTNPQFSKITDEMARRTYEESGNYVLDAFNVTTDTFATIAQSANSFRYVVDPGIAYIAGYRVETKKNFVQDVAVSQNFDTVSNTSIDIDYGNYVRVNEFAGLHAFSTASQVSLRNTAAKYLSESLGDITAPGSEIGKARIRSVMLENGVQGTPTAIYRLYLFDIRMNSGKNFKDVRSIYSDNATGLDGIADIIPEFLTGASSKSLVSANVVVSDASGNTSTLETQQTITERGAVLHDTHKSTILFDQVKSFKSVSNVRYMYRTITQDVVVSSSGTASIQKQASAEWPYVGTLSYDEERELIIVPQEDMISTVSLGTGSSVSSYNDTIGLLTATGSSFTSKLKSGDYIFVAGTDNGVVRVESVVDDTNLRFSPKTLTGTVSGESIYKVYPKNVPVATAQSSNATAAVVGDYLNLNLDITMSATANVDVVHNQRYIGGSSVQKSVNRKVYVKIQANTHPAGTTGPWCLGHSDVFRLRAVYAGANTSAPSITGNFNIDMKQKSNFYDHAYLYKSKSSSYTIGQDDELLVEFDVLTHGSEGVKTINSYNLNDELNLFQLDAAGNVMNLLEVPSFEIAGTHVDLRRSIDFRPASANTAVLTSDYTMATCNPPVATEATRFNSNGKRFPVPESDMFFDYEEYFARTDSILVNKEGSFEIRVNQDYVEKNPNQLFLYRSFVPPYPCLTEKLNPDIQLILNTRVTNEGKVSPVRLAEHTVSTESIRSQVFGYTMDDIRKLEERIQALEYNQNLSLLEDTTKNLSLTSSVDSTLERFKFGFFVDNFSDANYTDTDSEEHDSTFHDGSLQPASTKINLGLELKDGGSIDAGNFLRYTYVDKPVISQRLATSGPFVDQNGLNENEIQRLIDDAIAGIEINQVTQIVGGGNGPTVRTEDVCVVAQEKNYNAFRQRVGATREITSGGFDDYVYEVANTAFSITFYLINNIRSDAVYDAGHKLIVEQGTSASGPFTPVNSVSVDTDVTGRVTTSYAGGAFGVSGPGVTNPTIYSGGFIMETRNTSRPSPQAVTKIKNLNLRHSRSNKLINNVKVDIANQLFTGPNTNVYSFRQNMNTGTYLHNPEFGNFIRIRVAKINNAGTRGGPSNWSEYLLYFCYQKNVIVETTPTEVPVVTNPGPTITVSAPPAEPTVTYRLLGSTQTRKPWGKHGSTAGYYTIAKYQDGKEVARKNVNWSRNGHSPSRNVTPFTGISSSIVYDERDPGFAKFKRYLP